MKPEAGWRVEVFSSAEAFLAGAARELALTREHEDKLIRAIDMGGQFYSRQNTGFEPFTNDPIAGGQQY